MGDISRVGVKLEIFVEGMYSSLIFSDFSQRNESGPNRLESQRERRHRFYRFPLRPQVMEVISLTIRLIRKLQGKFNRNAVIQEEEFKEGENIRFDVFLYSRNF